MLTTHDPLDTVTAEVGSEGVGNSVVVETGGNVESFRIVVCVCVYVAIVSTVVPEEFVEPWVLVDSFNVDFGGSVDRCWTVVDLDAGTVEIVLIGSSLQPCLFV